MPNPMNGVQVTRRGNTIFVPLPRKLWTEASVSACNCPHCSTCPGRVGYWDTLAITQTPAESPMNAGDRWGASFTWTVHYPEINPDRLRGSERRLPGTIPTSMIAQRWGRLIASAARHARLNPHWPTQYLNGNRERRVVRARSINRAAIRTDNAHAAHLPSYI